MVVFKGNLDKSLRLRGEELFYKEMENNINLTLDMKEEFIESFIANTKSNIVELRMLIALSLVIYSLGGFDDDKKKNNYKGAIKILKRGFAELEFFNPLAVNMGASQIIKNPVVGVNFIGNFIGLITNLLKLPFTSDTDKTLDKIEVQGIKMLPSVSGVYGTFYINELDFWNTGNNKDTKK